MSTKKRSQWQNVHHWLFSEDFFAILDTICIEGSTPFLTDVTVAVNAV